VREQTGMRVAGGCFQDLIYVGESVGSVFMPKLLGTYERELHPVIEQIVQQGFPEIVDVGAAQGYYAVGLARRLPSATVVAFEATERGRELLAEMARKNGVTDRILIKGRCEPSHLRECLESMGSPLLICDVEGYEAKLLDPERVPEFRQAHILVELHDNLCPGVNQLVRSRFHHTHYIQEISQEPRTASEFPFRNFYTFLIPDRFLLNALREWRPEPMTWFWMRPRTPAFKTLQ
jgi:hypothetical protein